MTAPTNRLAPAVKWTREHTLAAFHLYTLLPFGTLHSRAPEIQQLAAWEGRTPNSVAMKLVNFASLDPQIIASGRAGLNGASNQDRALWQELQADRDLVAIQAANAYEKLALANGVPSDTPLLENLAEVFDEGITRSAVVQVRVNQARFRKAILSSYNATCCISGLQHEKLVIASHIVPWSEDTKNRLNPQNGLCLSALHDRAYDQGLITVMPDYTIRISESFKPKEGHEFTEQALFRFQNKAILLPDRLRPAPEFLLHHAKKFGFL